MRYRYPDRPVFVFVYKNAGRCYLVRMLYGFGDYDFDRSHAHRGYDKKEQNQKSDIQNKDIRYLRFSARTAYYGASAGFRRIIFGK